MAIVIAPLDGGLYIREERFRLPGSDPSPLVNLFAIARFREADKRMLCGHRIAIARSRWECVSSSLSTPTQSSARFRSPSR